MTKSRVFMMAVLSIFLSTLSVFGGCVDLPFPTHDPYEFPEFSTQYTEEEHIQRLSARTEEHLSEYIEEKRLLHYEVELVYSFHHNDPEYFLIEIEYLSAKYWGVDDNGYAIWEEERRYAHTIGYIKNDEYYLGLNNYKRNKSADDWCNLEGFILDKSLWQIFGYDEAKKYYGSGVQAVQTDKGILTLCKGGFSSEDIDNDLRFVLTSSVFEQNIINPNDYEQLMYTTWRRGGAEY